MRNAMLAPDPESGSWEGLAAAERRDAATWQRWAEVSIGRPGDFDSLRAYHAWIKSDQAAPAAPASAPDPFTGDQHATTRQRSRSGRTSTVVRRRGRYSIVGPDPFTGADLVRLSGVDLAKLADAWAHRAGAELPRLLGTDAVAFAEVIHAGNGAVDHYGVARHRADITDGLSGLPRSIARESCLRAVNGAEMNEHGEYVTGGHRTASETTGVPVRYSIRRVMFHRPDGRIGGANLRRRDTDPVDSRTFVVDPAGECTCTWKLVARADDRDRIWHGWQMVDRATGRNAARTARRAASAPIEPRAIEPEETTIADALASIPAGETGVVELPGVRIEVTRHAHSPMAVIMTRGAEVITFRARTAATIARRAIA